MDGPLSSSAGPTLNVAQRDKEKAFTNFQTPSGVATPVIRQRPSLDQGDGSNLTLQPPGAANGAPSVRTVSSPTASYAPRAASFNPSSVAGPGSFSSDLRSQIGGPSRTGSRPDIYSNLGPVNETTDGSDSEKLLADLRDELARENKIKEGSENMLEALNTKKPKHVREQKAKVEAELNASYARIRKLKARIEDVQQAQTAPITPTRPPGDLPAMFRRTQSRRSASRSGAGSDLDETVDPTYRLGELLQALEVEGLTPEYYVAKANALVALFKAYPNIKYDLVWSIFGLRMQVMLLSESREVVAAGYRMTRYAMSDRSSLKKIRTLNTDYVVIS